MQRDYQVAIVGAGPAGSTLAFELARRGIEVVVLEKQRLPRYKCCAGGISVGAARLLGTDVEGLAEDSITEATISFRGNRPFHGRYSQPIMYTVMRDRFDQALARRAKEAGAVVLEGHEVTRVAAGARWVEVSTSYGDFRAQYVAGADGARSHVARVLGLRNSRERVVAMQSEVHVGEEELTRLRSQVVIDIGRIPGGYAWLFPKLDHVSVGMACPESKAKDLKQRYSGFMSSLNLDGASVLLRSVGLLPIVREDPVVCQGRLALVGDAAGLADPLTGEGIYNAVWSAQLAAEAIIGAIAEGSAELGSYQDAIDRHIGPELKAARTLSGVFVRFPSPVFRMLLRDERVWRGCCRLLRRELTYTGIMQRLGGLRGLYAFLFRK